MCNSRQGTFKSYSKKVAATTEMRPYVEGEDLTGVSVSDADKQLSTLVGGYIARNPKNHADKWYVNPTWFAENYNAEGVELKEEEAALA